jgi:hypothetical protein
MKKVVVIISILIIIVVIIIILFQSGRTITLTGAENVTKIEMWCRSEHNDTGVFVVVDRYDIEFIMSALSGARKSGFFNFASNDSPLRQEYIAMYVYTRLGGKDVLTHRLFLFTENNQNYIWNSYVGVFKISQDSSNVIRHVYTDYMIIDN